MPGHQVFLAVHEVTSCVASTGVADLKVAQEANITHIIYYTLRHHSSQAFHSMHMLNLSDMQHTIVMIYSNNKSRFCRPQQWHGMSWICLFSTSPETLQQIPPGSFAAKDVAHVCWEDIQPVTVFHFPHEWVVWFQIAATVVGEFRGSSLRLKNSSYALAKYYVFFLFSLYGTYSAKTAKASIHYNTTRRTGSCDALTLQGVYAWTPQQTCIWWQSVGAWSIRALKHCSVGALVLLPSTYLVDSAH